MNYEPLLFNMFPGLRGRVPWMRLGNLPTPVERMGRLCDASGCRELWVKRDDLSGEKYGGNKVRKLEFTLADVKNRGRGTVITMGAVGSNHVLATTVHGASAGLSTVGIFMPQPVQEYLRQNILCNRTQGCNLEYASSDAAAVLKIPGIYLKYWRATGRRPYFLWFGGSSTLGVIGYVEAALELAGQVREGKMPEPDYAFVPVGSGGTFAGLILGLRLAGLKTRAVGVRVYNRSGANETLTAVMVNRAAALLRRHDRTVPRIKVKADDLLMLHDYFGRGYARFTPQALRAMEQAHEMCGLKLDGAYSGKAMAGFLDFMNDPARREKVGLFVATYNSRPLDSLGAGADCACLPPQFRDYFGRPLDKVEDI